MKNSKLMVQTKIQLTTIFLFAICAVLAVLAHNYSYIEFNFSHYILMFLSNQKLLIKVIAFAFIFEYLLRIYNKLTLLEKIKIKR